VKRYKPPRDYIKVFDRLGVNVVNTTMTGSSHYKITAECNGQTRFFIASNSGSDHRAVQNFESEIKKWQRSVLA
jgi:hypothetical protein